MLVPPPCTHYSCSPCGISITTTTVTNTTTNADAIATTTAATTSPFTFQWADKTLELNAGLFSGGDIARSLTMHARNGGVKFEPIDAAICEAALVKVSRTFLYREDYIDEKTCGL